jgi:hypothetical protein
MKKPFGNILVNSTLVFVAAFTLTTVVHEFGHFLSYLLFGADPTLFHNYVTTPEGTLSDGARGVSAMAGPVISLIQGIIFGLIVTRRPRNTPSYLFFLWFSLLGYVNFFGYLVMTPFSSVGDTGKVADLLGIAVVFRILIAVAGLALVILIILKIGKHFTNFIPAEHDSKMRSKYVYAIMFVPIIIGAVVNSILAFPAVAMLSVMYPATSSFAVMSSFGAILGNPNPTATISLIEKKVALLPVILAVVAIGLNRFLTLGIG